MLERRADAAVWGLVAGALDDDETLVDALRREVREETGLVVSRYELFGTFSDPSRVQQYEDGTTFQLVTLAYRAEVEDATVLRRSEESLELRFFAEADLPFEEVLAPHLPILRRYFGGGSPPFLD